jgi:hypothetical protein
MKNGIKTKKLLLSFTVTISEEERDYLGKKAEERCCPMTSVLRAALKYYMKEQPLGE